MTQTINSLAPWFGGKRTLAPLIVEELGKHSAYWEPFCGSMAVLLAKPVSHHEYVNDLHGDLINLARVIQDQTKGPRLYRRLRRVWMSEDELQRAKEMLAKTNDAEDRAFAYFIECWIARNGVSGTHSSNACMCVRYTSNGGAAAKRFRSAVDSIPAWRQRMRNVFISSRDGFEMLSKIADSKGTVIYCDPPYLVKSARYVHDFKEMDHERLAECLSRFRQTRVVVSYYEHAMLAHLYPGWTIRRIDVDKKLARQNKRGEASARATECLIINGQSLSASVGLFAG